MNCFMSNKDNKISFKKSFRGGLNVSKVISLKISQQQKPTELRVCGLDHISVCSILFLWGQRKMEEKNSSNAETQTYFAHAGNPLN